ncbi:regulatory protein RecX [Bifidobacterium callimiconis]|uniref:Regulatory protein RecX n=1 Tax=Bifidobacterium callimiconis TaxID=2306973 RepID=A0A430FD18_9BIFI|nr:regulatory protein RecX [Bifidobacterium callimiconis]RSX50726.1 RecX-like protein [Bifidobacterium callimiconis]
MISVEEFLRTNPVRLQDGDAAGSVAAAGGRSRFTRDDKSHGGRPERTMPRRGGFGSRGSFGEGPEDPRDGDACREAALSLLDAAPRSSGALSDRLKRKGYEEQVVTDVVDGLIRVGLVDDERYAQSMVRYCLSRHLGEAGTIREMTRKGVDRALAARVAAEAARNGDFVESAYELGRVVARRTVGMERDRRLRRFWSAGGRKGHAPDLIRQVAADVFHDDDGCESD